MPIRSSAILVFLLLVFYGLFLSHKVNLTTADLGRHLKNGELFFQDFKPIATNRYSYTEPDLLAINHHWGSGAVFFIIWKLLGFSGLQLFYIALSLITFYLFFWVAQKESGFSIAALTALALIPLLGERTEIRPEVFSYLFGAFFLFVLWRVTQGFGSQHLLWFLPIAEAFWVNTHIYFFLGPLIIVAFLFGGAARDKLKTLGLALLLTLLAMLVNPFGLKGALAPFLIFRNYDYPVLENQPLWLIENFIQNPNFLFFKLASALLIVSFLMLLIRRRRVFSFAYLILAIGVSVMGYFAVRNFALFGFFALPIMAANVGHAFDTARTFDNRFARLLSISIITSTLFLVVAGGLMRQFPYWREFGFGLEKGNSEAADFIRKEGIRGPILNSYDIGGYLIFHLFPQERVFVDNRPEAYSNGFFKDIYIPLQQDEKKWQDADSRYRFNAIVFSHRDATPWRQDFLVRRLNDPEWAAVFTDRYAIVLLRRNEYNRAVIKRHEAPDRFFKVIRPLAGRHLQ